MTTRLNDLDRPLGEALLAPTVIYTRSVLACLAAGIDARGLVHITGGGFYENIPRILPENTSVEIEKSSFDIPPLFSIIQREGSIDEREMFTTFNMGIGMMLFVDAGWPTGHVSLLRRFEHESPHYRSCYP